MELYIMQIHLFIEELKLIQFEIKKCYTEREYSNIFSVDLDPTRGGEHVLQTILVNTKMKMVLIHGIH